ncbi:MAG: hypothetical protein OHK93_007252 [Ramalina farinacea]|uniref:Rhodopsin domain-containing protein n=1 Tax=Ramalina farinacea TaxID=258253 RepID=A0AA43QK44_9LECA|nr:hypothetical protein [Ramalina farinacea]
MADHQILDNPYGGRGPLVLGVTWAEASLALVLMAMRTYTNASIVRSFQWDYFWAMLTLVVGLVTQAMITVSVLSGLGNHIDLLFGPQLVKANLWSWIGQIVAVQAIGFGKIAVIAFLLRIQNRAHSMKNTILVWILYFIGFSNVVINIDQMILILLQCDPVPKLWNQELPGTCHHIQRTNNVAYFQGTWAALSDILLAVYPVVFFWSLKISNKIKIGLCLLMAGGLIAAASGIVKTINLKFISAEKDITYFISSLVIWALTECWLVLILGCLPPLRPLFVSVFHQLSTTHSRPKHSGYYYNNNSKGGGIPMYPPNHSQHQHRAGTFLDDDDEGNDAESERKILGPEVRGSDGIGGERGILRTTHVHVASTAKAGTVAEREREREGEDSDGSLGGGRGVAVAY